MWSSSWYHFFLSAIFLVSAMKTMSQSFTSHRTGSLPSPLHIGGGGVEGGWGWGNDVSSSVSTSSPDSHWCEGEKGPPQLWQFSSLLEGRMGEVLRVSLSSEEVSRNFSGELRALCDFPMWIFKPFLVLNTVSHWSHWNVWFSAKACWLVSKSAWFSSEERVDFFSRNCFRRLAFLFLVEGLVLFFPALGIGTVLSLESKEKEKVLLMVRENLKALPWLFSAWQRARHLLAREESFSLTAAIFAYFWRKSKESAGARKVDMLSLSLRWILWVSIEFVSPENKTSLRLLE